MAFIFVELQQFESRVSFAWKRLASLSRVYKAHVGNSRVSLFLFLFIFR